MIWDKEKNFNSEIGDNTCSFLVYVVLSPSRQRRYMFFINFRHIFPRFLMMCLKIDF